MVAIVVALSFAWRQCDAAAAVPTPVDDPVDAPVERLLACVCATAPPGCGERRRADVTQTVHTVREVVREAKAPPVALAILLSTTCGESGARAHPRGSNDGGTSAGWYQIKRSGAHSQAFAELHGRALRWHDLREASAWYLRRVRRSRGIARSVCPSLSDAWGTGAARVARGPWGLLPVPAAHVWALDLRASSEAHACVPRLHYTPPVPGTQQCASRGYGRRARRWLKQDGAGAWR